MNATASSGGTATPPPESARIFGTAVPASIDATTGRAAAMIEYVLDGTLTRARPLFNGTTWMSPVANSSESRCGSM